MLLRYENLDGATRQMMVEEIDVDIAKGTLYLSPWLTTDGERQWAALLREAATSFDDEWLAHKLRNDGLIRTSAERRKPTGGYTTYRVPDTAPETMTGEFNIFYVRSLCRRALAAGIKSLVVYRAKQVSKPRPGSEEMIGNHIDAAATLDDLRNTHGTEPRLGFPPGPNSGLTARLP